MTKALILINSQPGAMKYIRKKVSGLENVEEANMLTGPYDIMVVVEADDIVDITNTLMGKIRNLSGVEDTVTNIVID